MASGGLPPFDDDDDDDTGEPDMLGWAAGAGSLEDRLNNWRSIGSDSQGRATAANNQRQPTESRKPFRFLQQQVSTTSVGGGSRGGREACSTSSEPSLLGPFEPLHSTTTTSRSISAGAISRSTTSSTGRVPLSEFVQLEEGAAVMPESSQLVSSLMQIRDNIKKATSVRDDLLEKNERSAKVDRLTRLIAHLKEQEKSYMRLLRRMLNDGEESNGDFAAESFSLGGSASLNVDVQSLASERSERSESTGTSQSTRRRPRIEDKLGATVSDEQMSDTTVTPLKPVRAQGPPGKSWSREPSVNGVGRSTEHETSGEQELKEELESLQKQRDLLTKMLQQQEQLKLLEGRQATLLAIQHRAEQALTGMDDSFVTEATGSMSGTSLTSELHDELSELMQKFNNRQSGTKQQSSQACPNNRRTVASSGPDTLSLAQEVSQARRDTAESQQLSVERAELTDKLQELQDKKLQMDRLMQELRSLQDQELNNSSLGGARNTVSHRSSHPALPRQISAPVGGTVRQPALTRLTSCSTFGATHHTNRAPAASFNASAASFNPLTSTASDNEGSNDENFDHSAKMQQLKEVRKRLNQLRELVSYYQQASDSLTESINELRDEEEEEENTEKAFLLDSEKGQEITHNLRRLGQDITQLTVANNMSRPQPSQRANNQASQAQLSIQGNNIRPSVSTQASAYDEDKDRDEVADTDNPEEVEDIEETDYLDADSVQSQNGSIDENEEDRVSDEDEHRRHHESQRSSLAESQETEILERAHNFDASQERLKTLRTIIATFQEHPETIEMSEEMESLSIGDPAHNETPNNTRANSTTQTRNPGVNPSEQYYKFRLEQQQLELRQLQKDRQRLLDIQDQLEELGKKCPDLQSFCEDSVGGVVNQLPSAVPGASSTPAICLESGARPRDKNSLSSSRSPVDTQLWSEIRRHQILREELRQRRKQLESMMTMQQSDQQEKDEASSEPIASECSDTQASYRLSRTERTMATWGGSTQYTIDDDDEDDEDDDDDDDDAAAEEELQNSKFCKVDGDEEDDEEVAPDEKPLDVFAADSGLSPLHELSQHSECRQRWERSLRNISLDGISPSSQTRRQENMSHQRQENSQWASELSFNEEKQQWQGQMDMLRSQLEFSTSMCQTLLQDQQTLSYLLQSALTGQYSTLPQTVGNPQVHFIMQQLTTCYSQLAVQQSNVQRLQTMLNETMQQQPGLRGEQRAASEIPSATSPRRDAPLASFGCPQSTGYHSNSFSNYHAAVPRFNMQPVYPLAMNIPTAAAFGLGRPNMPNNGNEPDLSLRSEYLPFPQLFASTAVSKKDTREHGKASRNPKKSTDELDTPGDVNGGASANDTLDKQKKISKQNMERGGRPSDEMSMGSMSSLLDPRDPSTITKTFRSQKSKAQASLASRDKTPVGRGRKRKIPILKGKSADVSIASGTAVAAHGNSHQLQTEQVDDATMQGGSLAASSCKQQQDDVSSEPGSEFSMFEALRDTIYSEVATLISQNENRPHFLIELFHELQMLNSDYLRQRALYLLQDTVTRHLTEQGAKEKRGPVWRASNSELTPSDSLATSDDEEQVGGAQAKRHSYSGMTTLKPERVELNENTSTNSSCPDPFANDELGSTVIHIEKALAKMKELKHLKEKSEVDQTNSLEEGAVGNSKGHMDDGSARDESDSESDVPCPRVDTQQVDRQIKNIMTEVIPYLKEHMDDICSPQLLTYIRRMVLSLTQQKDESKEFVRFFHKQLGSVLQESLNKFHGRRLKDCGEDLLVEISEILFNEFSFFRLMEDLDSSSRAGGMPSADCLQQRRRANPPPRWEVSHGACKQGPENSGEHKEYSNGSNSEGPATKDEQKNKDAARSVMTIDATEEEDLGKSRDDDLAMECQLSYKDDEDEGENKDAPPRHTFYSLSQAETLPLTNYGSGEDEEVEDEHEFDTARLDVPTSLQASGGVADDELEQIEPITTDGSQAKASRVSSPKAQFRAQIIIVDPVDCTLPVASEPSHFDDQPGDFGSGRENTDHHDTTTADATGQEDGSQHLSEHSSQDTESPILVNIPQQGSASSSGSLSQKSDEDDFVQIEDIPPKLTILCEEELRKKIEEEEKQNDIADALLTAGQREGELAGDAQAVKEPDSNSPRSG
ncbi:pericentriolar material 1 protein isoform X5 [Lampetra fluviatilis]